jgi:hypothetical protein
MNKINPMTKKELEKLPKKDLISLIVKLQDTCLDLQDVNENLQLAKTESSNIISSKDDIYLGEILPPEHVRLYSKSYNNPFLGLEIKGGELYERYVCDFMLTANILVFKYRTMTALGAIEDKIANAIRESSMNLTKEHVEEIKEKGLEQFVRDYFGFIDIVSNKNILPFSKYTFV